MAKTLVAFEVMWYEAWTKSLDAACAGLHATLLINDPDKPHRYFVNFDREIRQVIQGKISLLRPSPFLLFLSHN